MKKAVFVEVSLFSVKDKRSGLINDNVSNDHPVICSNPVMCVKALFLVAPAS